MPHPSKTATSGAANLVCYIEEVKTSARLGETPAPTGFVIHLTRGGEGHGYIGLIGLFHLVHGTR